MISHPCKTRSIAVSLSAGTKKTLLVLALLSAVFSCRDNDVEPAIPPGNKDTIPADTVKRDTTAISRGYIFDLASVPLVQVEITTDQWDSLLSDYDKNPDNQEYIKCNFSFTKNNVTTTVTNAGLRLRGNTSRRRPEGYTGQKHNSAAPGWHHASFTLDFNKYVDKQHFGALKKLHLKWFKDDPMYVREVYCYDLFRRFGVWTAPLSAYCRFNIKIKEDTKAAYFGVYEMIEPVDETFLEAREDSLPDTGGFLWKASYGASLTNANYSNMGISNITLTSTYIPVYDLKTNVSRLESAKVFLAAFINNFNQLSGDAFRTWLDRTIDVHLLLRTYAVNVICGMWDDYWNNSNNFYLYIDLSGKFYFIPFDYDNTLGTSFLMNDAGKQDPDNWGSTSNPLISKIISIAEYKTYYDNCLRELVSPDKDLFYVTKSKNRIVQWQSMINSYISNDTGEDMIISDRPASWGNCGFYRLLDDNNNYFRIKAQNIN